MGAGASNTNNTSSIERSTLPTINRIQVFSHCNNLGGKVWNPAIRWTKKYAVFVLLEDDSGYQGLGECWCFDSSPELLVTYLRTEMAPHIIGSSVEEIDQVFHQLLKKATLTARHGLLSSALSGVDIACWDLLSQHAEQPLWQHLNPAAEGSVFLYGSGGLYGQDKDIPVLVQEMRDIQAGGFSMLKIKVGALDLQADLGRVLAVLESLEVSTTLIIDGVYSYTVEEALQLYSALPPSRIAAFQSPLSAHDIAGMAELTKRGVPVMATEAEYRTEIHQQLVDTGAVRYLQVAPVACGGFSRLTQLCNSVKDTPIEISLEVSSTAVAFMAASNFAAAYPQVAHVEFHTVHQVFFDEPRAMSDQLLNGNVTLNDTHGLGITLPLQHVTQAFEQHV